MSGAISAIVPTYNRADMLREALDALFAQSRALDEILIWDDGSADHTQDVAQSFEIKRPDRVRYFRQENSGKGRALNAALAEARGDYIWICDDDDIARHDAAERMAAILDVHPNIGVAAGEHLRFRDDAETGERVVYDGGYWPVLDGGSPLRHVLEDVFFFQNAMLARRACYDRVGPFREDLARSLDYDMIARLAMRTPIEMIDAVLFEQRKHDGARGPAAARHAAADSDKVWARHDQEVFAAYRGVVPISLYEAMFEGAEAAVIQRAGLLQRGAVYARKGLWLDALEDCAAAALCAPETPLSALEVEICRRAVSGKHGCDGIFDSAPSARLRNLAQGDGAGRMIAAAFARGVAWRVKAAGKAGRLTEAARFTGFIARYGARGALVKPGAPELIERVELPAEAYEWT